MNRHHSVFTSHSGRFVWGEPAQGGEVDPGQLLAASSCAATRPTWFIPAGAASGRLRDGAVHVTVGDERGRDPVGLWPVSACH
jgi:hypothetical protein